MRTNPPSFIAALIVGGALLLTGCSSPAPTVTPEASPSTPATPQDAPSEDGTPRGTDLATATFTMSWTDALDAATERFAGKPVNLSLEWKRAGFAYEVDLVGETETYEAVFSADTGELVSEKTEQESPAEIAEKQREVFAPADLIDPAAAMQAALAAAPGTVDEWEIDEDDGRLTYQVQVLDGTHDIDVVIDAVTGDLIKIDR